MIDYIKARSVEEGDCWIWQGAIGSTGYPIAKLPGQPCQTVRRIALQASGKPLRKGQQTINICADPLCVNPAHARPSTHAKVQRLAYKDRPVDPVRSIVNQRTARARAKLDMDRARAIRASNDSYAALAAQHGVSINTIKRIRSYKTWRESASPWAGLGGRTK